MNITHMQSIPVIYMGFGGNIVNNNVRKITSGVNPFFNESLLS